MGDISTNSVSTAVSNQALSLGSEISSLMNDLAGFTLDTLNSSKGGVHDLSSQNPMAPKAVDIIAKAHSVLGGLGSITSTIA